MIYFSCRRRSKRSNILALRFTFLLLLVSLFPIRTCCLDMPSLEPNNHSKQKKASSSSNNNRHTSQFQAKQNHPTSFDDSPVFRGPIQLDRTEFESTSSHHIRIRNYYVQQGMVVPTEPLKPICAKTKTSTKVMLQTIVDQLAFQDAPVDVKEVAESIEFYLRTRKRLLGSVGKKAKKNENLDSNGNNTSALLPTIASSSKAPTITVYDLCSGHGLTGMLFAACNPPATDGTPLVQTILVDRIEPPSHQVLRKILAEVCPWLASSNNNNNDERGSTVCFAAQSLEAFQSTTPQHGLLGASTPNSASVAISTHACGRLTDDVLELAVHTIGACGIAVMPCCYTGTDKGTPYGIKRALGVSWAADIRRSFYLMEHGYHSDFATIPREITPMNRILVGEKRMT
jgi:hypothetical protein